MKNDEIWELGIKFEKPQGDTLIIENENKQQKMMEIQRLVWNGNIVIEMYSVMCSCVHGINKNKEMDSLTFWQKLLSNFSLFL